LKEVKISLKGQQVLFEWKELDKVFENRKTNVEKL